MDYYCQRCGSTLLRSHDEFVCLNHGTQWVPFRASDGVHSSGTIACAWCSAPVRRRASDLEYEQRRRPGAQTYCSLRCAAHAQTKYLPHVQKETADASVS